MLVIGANFTGYLLPWDPLAYWASQYVTEWYGEKSKPHYGTVLSAGRKASPEAREDLILRSSVAVLGSGPGSREVAAAGTDTRATEQRFSTGADGALYESRPSRRCQRRCRGQAACSPPIAELDCLWLWLVGICCFVPLGSGTEASETILSVTTTGNLGEGTGSGGTKAASRINRRPA